MCIKKRCGGISGDVHASAAAVIGEIVGPVVISVNLPDVPPHSGTEPIRKAFANLHNWGAICHCYISINSASQCLSDSGNCS